MSLVVVFTTIEILFLRSLLFDTESRHLCVPFAHMFLLFKYVYPLQSGDSCPEVAFSYVGGR